MKTIPVKHYKRTRIVSTKEILPPKNQRLSLFDRVKSYIRSREESENRFEWVAKAMTIQAFLITPLLSVIVIVTGNWVPLWFAVTASMYATFIPVLAGLPVRRIITVYFINLAVSVVIIAMAIVHLL